MLSPREMNAPSEMFFFLFNTIQECLLYLCRLTDWIGYYENKDDKKFKVVLRRFLGRFQISFL